MARQRDGEIYQFLNELAESIADHICDKYRLTVETEEFSFDDGFIFGRPPEMTIRVNRRGQSIVFISCTEHEMLVREPSMEVLRKILLSDPNYLDEIDEVLTDLVNNLKNGGNANA